MGLKEDVIKAAEQQPVKNKKTVNILNIIPPHFGKIKKFFKKTVCVYRILFRMCNNFVRKKVC